jgi:surface antigen
VLTSSVPTLAAPAPTEPAVFVDDDPRPLLGRVGVWVAPTPVAVRPVAVPRTVRVTPRHVVRTTKPQAFVRRTTAPRPTVKPTAPKPVSQTSQPSGVDDYPYRSQSDFYAIDKWGFTERQCVSFAAWRLAQHGHTISNDGNRWGSALNWDDAARSMGRTVTKTARIGAIAQWNAHESSPYYAPGSATANGSFAAGGYGHVGWVKKVYADGSALVEQYNMGGSRSYSVMRVKAPRYLLV